MLPVAAAPDSVPVGNLAIGAAVDVNAAAGTPVYAILPPKGWHDQPAQPQGPGNLDPDRAEPVIAGRQIDRGIRRPWPRSIDDRRVVMGRINDSRIGRGNDDVGPVVSTDDLVVRC